jgi:hypothetical protein
MKNVRRRDHPHPHLNFVGEGSLCDKMSFNDSVGGAQITLDIEVVQDRMLFNAMPDLEPVLFQLKTALILNLFNLIAWVVTIAMKRIVVVSSES